MTVLSRGSSVPVKLLRAHRIVIPTGADSDFHFAMLATTTYAVFPQENRMVSINAMDLNGKSGGA